MKDFKMDCVVTLRVTLTIPVEHVCESNIGLQNALARCRNDARRNLSEALATTAIDIVGADDGGTLISSLEQVDTEGEPT